MNLTAMDSNKMIQDHLHFNNDVVRVSTLFAGESIGSKKFEFDSQSQEHQVYYCINILMSALEDSVLRIIDVFSEMCLFFTCHYNATYLFV